jgi:hypothetical protein
MDVDGGTEPASLPANPLPLALSGPTSSPYAARIGVTWSGTLDDSVDLDVFVIRWRGEGRGAEAKVGVGRRR